MINHEKAIAVALLWSTGRSAGLIHPFDLLMIPSQERYMSGGKIREGAVWVVLDLIVIPWAAGICLPELHNR